MPKLTLRKGLKFTSTTSRWKAEISAIREDKNEVDVILTSTNDHAWEEKNWNLQHVIKGFEIGWYKETVTNQNNISVW